MRRIGRGFPVRKWLAVTPAQIDGCDQSVAGRGIEEEEARNVFNLGIGMCAVVPEPPAGSLVIGALE